MPRRFSSSILSLLVALFAVASDVPVGRADEPAQVSFELDVQPILTARGCNQGACHGKARGQNGFQLSLLGFDAEFDYAALTKNARGRRVFPASPERSLLLQKVTAQLPHGGGLRVGAASDEYETLRRWIAAGTPRRVDGEPTLTRIEAFFADQPAIAASGRGAEHLLKPGEEIQLRITAHYSDSSTRDVTDRTSFQSNEAGVVGVNRGGLVKAGPIPGEAAIMARYMTLIATCNIAIPLPGSVPDELYAGLPRNNFVDELAWQKMQSLGITPSPVADDSKILRRAYLDIIGRLPTPDEVRTFLADTNSGKRELLIDRLLDRPEYADHWAGKWADLLRPNPYRVGIKAVLNYDAWIRDSFRKNKPYDQFVRLAAIAKQRRGAVVPRAALRGD